MSDLGQAQETMSLRDLRKSRPYTQQQLATMMEISQPAVARLEDRGDIRISSLRRYIEALGGRMSITAAFPDGDVAITDYTACTGARSAAG